MDADHLREEFDRLANTAFETLELRRYLASPLTWAGHHARLALLRDYLVPTNRDCWAYVMGAAPLDVKRVIWQHEQEELIYDPRLGAPHAPTHEDRPDRAPGASPAADAVVPPPGVLVAMYARRQFAKDSPWLAGLAASHILERINDPTVVRGGGLVQRKVRQMLEDLGVSPEQVPARYRVHADADVEHGRLVWSVFERYVRDAATYELALEGARFGLACFRVYAGAVGDLMAQAAPTS